ncbi:MAG: hypothetical protein HQ526_01715 [Actinobacteria bacterium]|nr:hypothetical protein [Actinomycetota bacterium]
MSRRPLIALLVAAVAIVGVVALLLPSGDSSTASAPVEGKAKLINPEAPAESDDSGVTTPPDPQPELEIKKLAPGEQPPQFVVVSFDGGVESKSGLMQKYLEVGEKVDGRFSFFISGVYLLPDNEMKKNYSPPGKPRGTSDIGFADPGLVATRIDKLSDAWNAGHEIGTHYLGHFCGSGGVASWTAAQWSSEIEQFNTILDDWRTFNPQAADAGPLPFNPSVVKGGRTPCLEGNRPAMYKAFKKAGYLYDTSNSGTLRWPQQLKNTLWDIPLQTIKVVGAGYSTLSMDYNFLVNQNDGKQTASAAKCQQIEDQTYASYEAAFKAVRDGNRAPLILGNHMNDWVCGAYTKALTRFIIDAKEKFPETQFISTLDLVNFMEAQDPAIRDELQARPTQAQ